MTIIKLNVKQEWKIYSAEQFKKEFKRKEVIGKNECDEDYIMKILERDKRNFAVTFMEDPRDNSYEEYWLIQEVRK